MGGPGSGHNIDWQFELDSYNEQYSTDYQNKDDLLRELYCDLKSLRKVEEKLGGPSWPCIRNHLVKTGAHIQSKGGANNKGMKFPFRRRVRIERKNNR